MAEAFPTGGILPKEEIGALRFLAEHPTYDGRGVVVAIFDTGIDPGASGLQVTADGRPKILDLIDATGSGDVDTRTVRRAEEGQLEGLSGRTLCLEAGWSNPTGDYHLGLKRAYELFPGPLVERLKRKRKEAWDEQQRLLETRLERDLESWDAVHPDPTGDVARERHDLEQRLEQLRRLQRGYDDPGPVFDCVVFHDGTRWRGVVDTDEDGDLSDETLLAPYRDERQYATFGPEALLNFALDIYDDGAVLSIVTDSGMHGTHVAGIVAACFPEQPERNGVAPGAQLVSIKIGDTRLGGMETAAGVVRAASVVRELGCDVVNMSYGEPTTTPNTGRLIEVLAELVREHGVVFVASAGNDGPALSTVGAPGGTTSELIGVGAYLSPALMAAGYSMREIVSETHYTWSSRGPTLDGDLGVNVSAPGGAISPVPTWTLRRSQLAHGTSMASPSTAGAVALILSGLKAENVEYRPHLVRRALENSARALEHVEVFAQGHGLIQVDRAFDLCKLLSPESAGPQLVVSLSEGGRGRGVYLREPDEVGRPRVTSVRVEPVYPKVSPNPLKVDFERRFRIEATAPWVEVPPHLFLAHGGRSFEIRLDPTTLDPGVHYAEVLGMDAVDRESGPVFRVPVTVIRPEPVTEETDFVWSDRLELRTGKLERRFLGVPDRASRAELAIRAENLESACRLVVHAAQALPSGSNKTMPGPQYVTLDAYGRETIHFPVVSGGTLELCIGQNWSSLGEGAFECELTFHGLIPDDDEVFVDGSARVTRVEVAAPLREMRLTPRAELRTRRRSIVPSQADLRPLSAVRDQLSAGRQINELVLSYSIAMEAAATVVPRFPSLNGRLYDGEFESQLYMIFDAGKRLVTVDDGWAPGPVRLEPGDYELRLQLRHDRIDWLERLKTLPLALEQELPSPVALEAYANPDAALTGGAKFGSRWLNCGERAAFYLAAPPGDKSARPAKPGELLLGSIQYETADGALGYPLAYLVPATPPTEKPEAAGDKTETGTTDERLADELRDFRVRQLDSLGRDTDAGAFADRVSALLAEYPDHLPVYIKNLHRLDNSGRERRLRSVVTAADAIISRIDATALAAHFGTRPDLEDAAVRRLHQEMEERKSALLDALDRKARALACMERPENEGERETGDETEDAAEIEPPFDSETVERLFEETFAELRRWVDPTDGEYVPLNVRREWRQGHLGAVLKGLNAQLAKRATDAGLYRQRIQVLEDLGWTAWVELEKVWMLIRFPRGYPPF